MSEDMEVVNGENQHNTNAATIGVRFPYTLQLIQSNHPKLQEVNLAYQFLNANEVHSLVEPLKNNRHLLRLNLSYNVVDDKGIEALSKSGSLEELYLDSNKLTDQHALTLASNTSMVGLSLNRNQIGASGAEALAKHPMLRGLNLRNNQVPVSVAQLFLENQLLTNLDITFTDADQEHDASRQLRKNIKKNKKSLLRPRNDLFHLLLVLWAENTNKKSSHIGNISPDLLIKTLEYLDYWKLGKSTLQGVRLSKYLTEQMGNIVSFFKQNQDGVLILLEKLDHTFMLCNDDDDD